MTSVADLALRLVPRALSETTVALLSIRFVLSFFALVGLRVLFAVPTDVEANWIFQMTESRDRRTYLDGVYKAMLLIGLAPIAVVTFPMYAILWGLALALAHAVFWLLVVGLLTELLLVRLNKLPFTCSYMPGKSNITLLGPAYLGAMMIYVSSIPRIEMEVIAGPVSWTMTGACLAAMLAALSMWRKQETVAMPSLKYREVVKSSVQALNLGQGTKRSG